VVFLGMPRPDGFELARGIRNAQTNRKPVVVMLSATDDIEMLRKAFGGDVSFVLPKPIAAARIIPMLTAMESPRWKATLHAARLRLSTDVICKCGDREFPIRSMNISETGMLLQSSHEVEVGQEVSLEFKIAEVRASLSVRARIVRKEGTTHSCRIHWPRTRRSKCYSALRYGASEATHAAARLVGLPNEWVVSSQAEKRLGLQVGLQLVCTTPRVISSRLAILSRASPALT